VNSRPSTAMLCLNATQMSDLGVVLVVQLYNVCFQFQILQLILLSVEYHLYLGIFAQAVFSLSPTMVRCHYRTFIIFYI